MMGLKFSGYLESSDCDLVNKMKTKVAAEGGGGRAGSGKAHFGLRIMMEYEFTCGAIFNCQKILTPAIREYNSKSIFPNFLS